MARCEYVTDDLVVWQLRVDAQSAADPARGWTLTEDHTLPLAPRGFAPRVVLGIDDQGRSYSTRVGTNTCDLWTGLTNTFDVETSDGSMATAFVVGRRRERQY